MKETLGFYSTSVLCEWYEETVVVYYLHHFQYLLSVVWGRERTGASLTILFSGSCQWSDREWTWLEGICSPPAQAGASRCLTTVL